MNLVLQRISTSRQGTFGILRRWHTLEPALDHPTHPCVPEGTYPCVWAWSPRLKRFTYRLLNTAPRSGILIHPLNLASQSLGCIGFGEKLGWIRDVPAILLSRPAVREFEDMMDRRSFTLTIVGVAPQLNDSRSTDNHA